MKHLSQSEKKQAIRSCVTYPLAESLKELPHAILDFKDWAQLEQELVSNIGVRVVDKEGIVKEMLPFLADETLLAREAKWMDIAIGSRVIRVMMNGSSLRVLYVNVDSLHRALDALQGIKQREDAEWQRSAVGMTFAFVAGMLTCMLIRK